MRGVAALWVAGYHLLLPAGFAGAMLARLLGRGYLAVDLFFILSGYVMALTYGQRFAGKFSPGVFAAFLRRRVARLYPIYGTILITRLVWTACRYRSFALPRPWIAAPLPHPWTDIPANLLLVQSWGVAPSSIGPAWSISTEWGAYCLFPLLATVMLHRGARAAMAGTAAAVLLLGATALLLQAEGAGGKLLDAWDGRTAGPIMRCLAGFILGLGVWRLASWPPTAKLAAQPWVGVLISGALFILLIVNAPDPIVYAVFPPLVLYLACGRTGVAAALGWRTTVWLGEISYSLYLLHIFLLHPLDQARAMLRMFFLPPAADALAALAVFAFLLAAADASYRLIERPGRRMLARAVRI